jgi:isopenicillin N synthase-like dioxygenase
MKLEPIDISGWDRGGAATRQSIAAAVDAVCSDHGFLAIAGHDIAPDFGGRVLDTTQTFFDRPMVEKMALRPDKVEGNRGYSPPGIEALSYSRGEASPPDLFEAFNVGAERVPPGVTDQDAERFFFPNVWPDEPAAFRATIVHYYDECEQLGRQLLDIFAMALGLPDRWFRSFFQRSPNVLRANHYIRHDGAAAPEPGQLRMGAHSDYGSLTILLADDVPGLQIRDRDNVWHDVQPAEGTLFVNLGDLLAEWTNDRWHSTVHRVVPPPIERPGAFRRRSVAWFQQPDHDAVIEVLSSCTSADNPPRYPPTTAGEHLLGKLRGSRELLDTDVDLRFLEADAS